MVVQELRQTLETARVVGVLREGDTVERVRGCGVGVWRACGGCGGAAIGAVWGCGVDGQLAAPTPTPTTHTHHPTTRHTHTVQRIGSGALAADTGLAEGRGMADTVVLVREGGGREGVAAIRVHSSVVGQDKGWKKMLFFGAWRGRPGGGGR